MKIKFIFFILIFNVGTIFPSEGIDSLLNSGLNAIYNVNFEKAEDIVKKIEKEYPEHPSYRFFDAMRVFWKILVKYRKSPELDEVFLEKAEKVIKLCDNRLKKDEEDFVALFYKGGIIGFKARLYVLRKKWIKAGTMGKKGYKLIKKASEVDPDNIDVKLGFGIYNYYAKAVPDEYPFLKPFTLFVPSGDKKKGVEQLKTTYHKGELADVEALFQLVMIYYFFEKNYKKSGDYALKLHERFPSNPLFIRYLARSRVKQFDFSKAFRYYSLLLERCKKRSALCSKDRKREAYYYKGFISFQYDRFSRAKKFFKKCLTLSRQIDKKEESGYWVNSLLFLGMAADALHSRKKAVECYEKVLDLRDYKDSHDKAEKFLEEAYGS